MMKTADFRDRYDISRFGWLNGPGMRCVLLQCQMRSGVEVIAEVPLQNPSQMPLSQHDDVIEAFSPNAANQPFREWILPGTPRCGEHFSNAHSLNSLSEVAAIHSVTVPYQVSRCRVLRKRFYDLLRRPFGGGMFRNVEMQDPAPLMRQDTNTNSTFN